MPKIVKPRGVSLVAILLGATCMAGGQAAADQVIPDDLIVQQSLCTGFDCVNNEDFQFSTIRLKENNTRIDFMDTSTGTFPTRDWRLEANSDANGGANYFAIKDMGNTATGAEGGTALLTVTAGAPANSLFVNSSGRVGLRTSTPVLDLHVRTSNTPGLRLEQDSSGGFTAQTWDIAGNEANFFVRDVTGGSRLPFRIRPGAPTSSLDIANTGFVGIGTGSPAAPLHVRSSEPALRLESNDAGSIWSIRVAGGNLSFTDEIAGITPFRVRPGAPFNSLEIRAAGTLTFGQYPNCASLGTNASGVVQCNAGGGGGVAASVSAGYAGSPVQTAAVSVGGASGGAGSGPSAAGGGNDSAENQQQVGCRTGDLAGDWSLIGTGIDKFGNDSMLWCDLRFTAAQDALTYHASGRCWNHEPNASAQQTPELTARGTITENSACRFGGSLAIKQGNGLLTTATIIRGRIEGSGARKTRAVGMSRLTRGRTNALQMIVMQR